MVVDIKRKKKYIKKNLSSGLTVNNGEKIKCKNGKNEKMLSLAV
jgi:hypothetical protein